MSVVFSAPAAFDAVSVAQLRSELDRLAQSDHDVIVDMGAVTAIDGSGVGAIAYLVKRLALRDRRLLLVNVGGAPRTLLASTGMLKVLEASPAIEAAIQAGRALERQHSTPVLPGRNVA